VTAAQRSTIRAVVKAMRAHARIIEHRARSASARKQEIAKVVATEVRVLALEFLHTVNLDADRHERARRNRLARRGAR